jgi:hypothetical protein
LANELLTSAKITKHCDGRISAHGQLTFKRGHRTGVKEGVLEPSNSNNKDGLSKR